MYMSIFRKSFNSVWFKVKCFSFRQWLERIIYPEIEKGWRLKTVSLSLSNISLIVLLICIWAALIIVLLLLLNVLIQSPFWLLKTFKHCENEHLLSAYFSILSVNWVFSGHIADHSHLFPAIILMDKQKQWCIHQTNLLQKYINLSEHIRTH